MEVFISNNKVIVDENKLISSGYSRIGNVYIFDNEHVIKLYHYINSSYNDYRKNRLDILHQQKVKKFIMPLDIAYDMEGNIIGYTMKYVKGKEGKSILNLSSKFLIEELEKIYDEVSILSQNNIVIDDLAACNLIVNKSGIYFIDTDDYIVRTRLDYDKNMRDSNFNINTLLKDIFAIKYNHRNNIDVYNIFDSYDFFYEEAKKIYKPNQSVKSLVKCMIRKKEK